MKNDPLLTIGVIAKRTSCAVSTIRFYADQGLVPAVRAPSGHRLFHRSVIRRISFILISQRLGYTLGEIETALTTLPNGRTPTKAEWATLSKRFSRAIDQRIADLTQLKHKLTGCIGCGCLSLKSCQLYNTQDKAGDERSGADLYFSGVE